MFTLKKRTNDMIELHNGYIQRSMCQSKTTPKPALKKKNIYTVFY